MSATLATQLAQGRATEADLFAVGRAVAALHAAAPLSATGGETARGRRRRDAGHGRRRRRPTGAEADDRRDRGLELLGVAERFAWRARLPRIVRMTGLTASGKSTVAEALAAAEGRPVLSSDRIRKLRAGVDP